jgi:hypothetical protein
MRQIDKSQTALYVGDAASLEKALEHFANVSPGFPRMAAQ